MWLVWGVGAVLLAVSGVHRLVVESGGLGFGVLWLLMAPVWVLRGVQDYRMRNTVYADSRVRFWLAVAALAALAGVSDLMGDTAWDTGSGTALLLFAALCAVAAVRNGRRFDRLIERETREQSSPWDGHELSLADLRDEPAVAAVLAECPQIWRNCVDFDTSFDDPRRLDARLDDDLLPTAWVSHEDGEWGLGLGDEWKPSVVLDAPEDADGILLTLRSDPRVTRAYHEDREVYRWSTAGAMPPAEAAALAVRALLAGHRRSLSAAGISDR